jgi:hypothetical protein
MRANSVIIDLICGGAVLGLAVWLAVEHQTRVRVDREHAMLAQRVEQMSQLIARNQKLTDLVGRTNGTRPAPDEQSRELLRLRGQVGVLREQCKELEHVRSDNRRAHAMLQNGSGTRAVATADYWPRDSWNFTGYGSPDAALQSSLWAANNGDLKALLASTTGDLRKTVEADLAGKSKEEAEIKAMDEVINFKSVRVLNREAQGDGAAILTVAIEDKTETQTVKMLLKKVGNEWKISGSSQ